MNNFVKIKIGRIYEEYILKKMLKNNIDIYKSYEDDKNIYYFISEIDYDTLVKLDYRKVIKFDDYCGLRKISFFLKKNIEKIIISFFIVFILFLSKNLIIKVNITVDDLHLKNALKNSLIDEGIKDISIRKSYKDLEAIKERILYKYNDEVEWIEISNNGYICNINIIKRKINKDGEHHERCNYVAKKSGTIKTIKAKKGVLLVQENNYVNKGDILISGDIIYNDELKNSVCASGKITGETWYKVNVSYPLKKTVRNKKKNGMYNIELNILDKKYYILKDRYKSPTKIFSIGKRKLGIRLTKSQKEYKKTYKYSPEEALKKAVLLSKKKVLQKSGKESKILSENILKKNINNDKIDIEVLITVEEELGVVENYKVR